MRCEICNRSMTETVLDGAGQEHEYCHHCNDEILDTIGSYDDEEEEAWWPELYPDDNYEETDDDLEPEPEQ